MCLGPCFIALLVSMFGKSWDLRVCSLQRIQIQITLGANSSCVGTIHTEFFSSSKWASVSRWWNWFFGLIDLRTGYQMMILKLLFYIMLSLLHHDCNIYLTLCFCQCHPCIHSQFGHLTIFNLVESNFSIRRIYKIMSLGRFLGWRICWFPSYWFWFWRNVKLAMLHAGGQN